MKNLYEKIKEFWVRSYTSDRKAFYLEMIASILVVISTTSIAITADNPPMHLIYPVTFVSALVSIWAYIRRGVAWPLLMTTYFAFVHIFGFGRAMLWW
jgi:hypothetical protein